MARNAAGAPAMSTWARQAARVIADRQPLLVFPVVSVLVQLPLILPFVLATRSVPGFDGFARDFVFTESRMIDLLGAGTHGSAIAAGALFVTAQALVRAWLSGAMIRSLDLGSPVWWPGRVAFRRLLVVYLGAEAFVFLGTGPVALLAALVAFVLFSYADYIVVFEGRTVVEAIRLSVTTCATAWRIALLGFSTLFLVSIVEYGLFIVPIHDAAHVSMLLFGADLLFGALVDYASSCALAAVLYGDALTRSR